MGSNNYVVLVFFALLVKAKATCLGQSLARSKYPAKDGRERLIIKQASAPPMI